VLAEIDGAREERLLHYALEESAAGAAFDGDPLADDVAVDVALVFGDGHDVDAHPREQLRRLARRLRRRDKHR